MRISDLHIYGFGKLENFHLKDLKSLQLIYGENEAGKSTIMAFIHAVLFGFPTRQAKNYEPKTHSKYGGKLTLETVNMGKAVIERVKGTSSSSVTVRLDDGTIGGEDLLRRLLNGMDENFYRSIFSFDVHGLQKLHQLKEEDIGRFLFSAGTVGTDSLYRLEKKLQKEMEKLYKPNGRNPVINQELQTLKELEADVKKGKKKNDQYLHVLVEIENQKQHLSKLSVEEGKCQAYLERLAREETIRPLLMEKQRLEEEMKAIGEVAFPVDGISRLEKHLDRLHHLEGMISALQEKIDWKEKQIRRWQNDLLSLEEEAAIEASVNQSAEYKKWQEDWQNDQMKISELNSQLEELKTYLHFEHFTDEEIYQIDTSMDVKRRIKEEIQKLIRLISQKEHIEKALQTNRSELQTAEKECEKIEELLLPEQEFRTLQKKAENQTEKESLAKEIRWLELQLQKIETEKQAKKRNKQPLAAGFVLVFSIVLALWLVIQHEWLLLSVPFFGFVAAFLLWTKKTPDLLEEQEKELKKEINQRKKEIQEMGYLLTKEEASMYRKQTELRDRWKQSIMRLEQLEQQKSKLISDKKEWEREFSGNLLRVQRIQHKLCFPKTMEWNILDEAFEKLLSMKYIIRQKKICKERMKEMEESIQRWKDQLHRWTKTLGLPDHDIEYVLFQLKEQLKKNKEKALQIKETSKQAEQYKEELQAVIKEKAEFEREIQKLFASANTETEEDFRKKGTQWKKLEQLKERLELIHRQVPDSPDLLFPLDQPAKWKKAKLEVEEKLKELGQEKKRVQADLAKWEYEKKVLEEGGTYAERLHLFHLQRSVVNEKAKKWAQLAIAKHIFAKTVKHFKDQKLPLALQKAEELLSMLTNGRYIHLYTNEEGKFYVKRKDGMFFEPQELSQATGEQVYVSLRLALASVLQEEYPFPLIIDDAFVHFDHKRMSAVAEVLKEVSRHTQILIFTCHQHVKMYFPETSIIHLEEPDWANVTK
ncbi:AAA family ATPase [Bacillus smithii]|uniref:ATP-binding protein n=1 Tax=Bacillus smithii TaxID=1479 RepID=UPI003D20C42D